MERTGWIDPTILILVHRILVKNIMESYLLCWFGLNDFRTPSWDWTFNKALQKKSDLSQKRDQPIMVVIGSQNKYPLANFLDQFICARYSSLKSGIPAISLFSHSLKDRWKNLKINTIDWCYIEEYLEFFSEVFVYIPL